jgi:hypothetical protein
LALAGELTGQVGGQGGLAYASLGIGDDDDGHGFLRKEQKPIDQERKNSATWIHH